MSRKPFNFKEQFSDEIVINSEGCLFSKMQIFRCSCGDDILIVPDVKAMNTALRNHLTKHAGQFLTEQNLVETMLRKIAERYFRLANLNQIIS